MVRKLLAFTFLLFAVAAADAQPPKDTPEVRRAAFEKVWSTVNEKHYDPTFGGVDWKKVRETYEPRAMAAGTSAEFHAILRKMLGELKVSHFGIFAAEPVATANSGSATSGVELTMIGTDAVVRRVLNGGTTLKPGFVLKSIDGRSVVEILAPLEKSFADRALNDRMKLVYRERFLESMLDGKIGTIVRVGALDERGKLRVFDVPRFESPVEMSAPLGNFPGQPVVFESKMLDGNVGYIRFSIWVVPQIVKIRAAMRELAGAKAIIFDLRGNPGGVGGLAPGVAGLLLTKQASLGSMNGRDSSMNFIAYPQTGAFAGKVAILTNYGSASTTEVFAAGLQDLGRATIVGEQSAGAVLPSVFEILPTGATFQYAISDYRTTKNVLVEGRGVTPDIIVPLTRESLLRGRDAQLDAAVREVLK